MKDDEKSVGAERGTDRPLPAGWGWRPGLSGQTRLMCDADADESNLEVAFAYDDGIFSTYKREESSDSGSDHVKASPRPGESLLAAAQREAEAALWRVDGFGVGRVYGARLDAAEVSVGGKPVSLPGLPGLWRITDADHRRGAMVVDAVRVPFDTQAEADAAPLTHALDAEGNALCPYDPATLAYVSQRAERVTCPACIERAQATAEDAPLPWNWCPTCKQHVDIDDEKHEGGEVRCIGCGAWYVVCCEGDGSGKWWLESREDHDAEDAEPAPHEPSAPNDGDELARLLPGLADKALNVRRMHALDLVGSDTSERDCARACELLLAERERMAAAFATLSDDRIALHAGNEAQRDISATQERTIDALRARVAELEDERAREPSGHRVAALLADLKRMREEGDGGMREAIDAVREHLGAPTPLDLAAAEVCAVDAAEVADTFDAWAALGDICRAEADGLAEERAQFAKAGRVALAGMLACDAADRGKGPPRDPYGHLDPCAACGERPAMICDLCSICEEQQHQTGGKWDGETLARMKAERAAKGDAK